MEEVKGIPYAKDLFQMLRCMDSDPYFLAMRKKKVDQNFPL